MKICRKCKKEKLLDDFYKDYRSQYHRSTCKECHLNASAEWRKNNRGKHNAKAMRWYHNNPEKAKIMNTNNYKLQNEKRDSLQHKILNDHLCLICGESRHGCLTFHHLNPSEKEHGVTSHSLTWKKMLVEVSKCVVLCANCHMLHHHGHLELPEKSQPIDVSNYLQLYS